MESAIKMWLIEVADLRGRRTRLLMKRLSVVQDEADAFMALRDMTNRNGLLSRSTTMAPFGLLLVLMSIDKNELLLKSQGIGFKTWWPIG